MASKAITLNIAERIYSTNLLGMWKGNVMTDGAHILEGAKQIVLTDEERSNLDLKQDGATVTWNAEKGFDKEVTLNSETIAYLLEKMKERDDAKETTFGEIAMVQSLRDKLN